MAGEKMEHQTFSKHGLEKAVRKSDFLNVSKEDQEAYREKLILGSMLAAKTRFSAPSNPLSLFRLNGNLVFKLDKHSDRIVERRLTANLRRACGIRAASRSAVIENLKIFLKEGVPFRIYRLDIRKFYESFPKEAIKEKIDSVSRLSSPSKSLIKAILDKHSQIGGNGTPRGLAISSVITELMMRDFDRQIHNNINTFFYSRYVDDIIVITSSDEDSKEFIAGIKKNLPQGLTLNPSKLTVSPKVAPLFTVQVVAPKVVVASFEYLGYKLTISNPYKMRSTRTIEL
ncbi:RNA-directed DNA polymerase (plasmid) [Alcaligenes faecalis]|nr:RNA-directed DNA polymerase [Alcaligenes faecalis]